MPTLKAKFISIIFSIALAILPISFNACSSPETSGNDNSSFGDDGPPDHSHLAGPEFARGVPQPSNAFKWDPLTFDKATTRTETNVPATVSAGESVLVTGTGGASIITFNCTAEAPCILKSNGTPFLRSLTLRGKHFVVDGFVFQHEGGNAITVNPASYGVIRNCEHSGDNTSTSNGTSMTSSFSSYIVFYRNRIHNIAVYDGLDEVDYIGFVVRNDASYFWYLENEVYNLGADSIRTGTNLSRLAEGLTPPHSLFIAKNIFRDNGENPIDLKYSRYIVISENELGEATPSVSDSGTAIAIHESADQVKILSNRFYEVNRGIATTTSGGGAEYILVDGNTFEDITEYGVYNRGGGHADIFENTFINVTTPIQNNVNNGSTITERDNIIQ